MKHEKRQLGDIGENIACDYLIGKGFKILARNFIKTFGEIDIVAERDQVLRFVEVKTSLYYPDSAFMPEIRVDRKKIANLKKICGAYLRETNTPDSKAWQVDVISVILDQSGAAKDINHIENAVFEKRY